MCKLFFDVRNEGRTSTKEKKMISGIFKMNS